MTYQEAIDKRTELERTCTDAEEWERMAKIFYDLGALSASGSCLKRANHYRSERDRETFIDTWRLAFDIMEQELKNGVNFAEIPCVQHS